jgi:hypothetical protein
MTDGAEVAESIRTSMGTCVYVTGAEVIVVVFPRESVVTVTVAVPGGLSWYTALIYLMNASPLTAVAAGSTLRSALQAVMPTARHMSARTGITDRKVTCRVMSAVLEKE